MIKSDFFLIHPWAISGKLFPTTENSLQAETPYTPWYSDGHAAVLDDNMINNFLSFRWETSKWTSERSGARGQSN